MESWEHVTLLSPFNTYFCKKYAEMSGKRFPVLLPPYWNAEIFQFLLLKVQHKRSRIRSTRNSDPSQGRKWTPSLQTEVASHPSSVVVCERQPCTKISHGRKIEYLLLPGGSCGAIWIDTALAQKAGGMLAIGVCRGGRCPGKCRPPWSPRGITPLKAHIVRQVLWRKNLHSPVPLPWGMEYSDFIARFFKIS